MNIFVRPALDAQGNAKRVPDPATGAVLPAAGAWKVRTAYWLRRVLHGDAIEGETKVALAAVESDAGKFSGKFAPKAAPRAAQGSSKDQD